MTLALPRIVLPRFGSWWRLPRFDALAMAHLKKDPTTGHLLKHPTSGHLVKGCGDEICSCTPSVALYATVSVEGISVCTTCYASGGTSRKYYGSPNGVWELPKRASGCGWIQTGITSFGTHRYSGTICAGDSIDTAYSFIAIDEFVGDVWTAGIQDGTGLNALFSGYIAHNGECYTEVEIPNNNNPSGCGSGGTIYATFHN